MLPSLFEMSKIQIRVISQTKSNNRLSKYIITREGNELVTPQGSRNKIFNEDEKVIFAYDYYIAKFKNFFALYIDKQKNVLFTLI